MNKILISTLAILMFCSVAIAAPVIFDIPEETVTETFNKGSVTYSDEGYSINGEMSKGYLTDSEDDSTFQARQRTTYHYQDDPENDNDLYDQCKAKLEGENVETKTIAFIWANPTNTWRWNRVE